MLLNEVTLISFLDLPFKNIFEWSFWDLTTHINSLLPSFTHHFSSVLLYYPPLFSLSRPISFLCYTRCYLYFHYFVLFTCYMFILVWCSLSSYIISDDSPRGIHSPVILFCQSSSLVNWWMMLPWILLLLEIVYYPWKQGWLTVWQFSYQIRYLIKLVLSDRFKISPKAKQ